MSTELQTPTVETGNFFLSIPIQKIDKEKRLVHGVVTAEVLDRSGDVVDYPTAKRFFEGVNTGDPTLWPGNMREMHRPEAVGKAVSVEFDDVNKTISLTSRVSKGAPTTWEKILDGTLSMYSIGGSGDRKIEKFGEKGAVAKRLFLTKLAEVSYVDNGACPVAKFDVLKSATAPEEVVKFESGTAAAEFLKSANTRTREEIAEVMVRLPEPVRKGMMEPYDIEQALAAIALLNRLMSNEYWEARAAAYNGESAETEISQVATLKAAISAVIAFVLSEFEEQFKEEAPQAMAPVSVDAAVAMAVHAIDVIKAGARHSKSDSDKIQAVHDHSVALGAMCTNVEKSAAVTAARKAETVSAEVKDDKKVEKTESGDITKLEGLLTEALTVIKAQSTTLKEQGDKLTTQGDTIAKLGTELEEIKKMAVPGGPRRSAAGVPVEKQVGGGDGATVGEGDFANKINDIIAGMQVIGSKGDSDVKKAAAESIVKLQTLSGVGRFDFKVG